MENFAKHRPPSARCFFLNALCLCFVCGPLWCRILKWLLPLLQEEKLDVPRNKMESESSKSEQKDGGEDDVEDDGHSKGNGDEGSSTSLLGPKDVKQEDEEQESKNNSG